MERESAQKIMEKYERPTNLGEYDRPLPPVNPNPSKEDQEKLQYLIEKYKKMAEDIESSKQQKEENCLL